MIINKSRPKGPKSFKLLSLVRKESPIAMAFACLDDYQQRKIVRLALLQSCLNILDIIAVGLIGLVGSLTVYGVQSRSGSTILTSVLNILHLQHQPFQLQVALLAISATTIFISKSILSYRITRMTVLYLSELSAGLSKEVLNTLSFTNLNNINSASTQDKLYSVTMGTYYLTIGIIAPAGVILSDIVLMGLLLTILILANFVLALSLVFFFGFVGLIIYKKLSNRSFSIGTRLARLEVESNIQILEGFKFSRDFALRNSKVEQIDKVALVRREIALNQGKLSLLPNVTKYIIESSILVAALIVAAIQFLFLDASGAFASLALFLAAGSRIAPAALRIQHALMSVRLSTPGAMKAINLIEPRNNAASEENFLMHKYLGDESSPDLNLRGAVEVSFSQVTYREPENDREILNGIDFTAHPNSISVIIGPTGAGKSTILDLAMGVLQVSNGKVSISNLHPKEFIARSPNLVRYVPQNVEIRNDTLRDNIIFGSNFKEADQQRLLEVLKITKLTSVVSNLPNGIQTMIGDGGQILSGGEIQRIGIARAIFDQPKLLLLDEVTSSLDRETENLILEMISDLKEKITIIMIAHRVSNMEIADQIVYIKNGRMADKGNLSAIRARNPDLFDNRDK